MSERFALGVDFGGTSMRVALVSARGAGRAAVAAKRTFETKKIRHPAGFVDAVASGAKAVLAERGIARGRVMGIGLGLPGSVDSARGLVHGLPNVPGWKNVPIRRLVERRLGLRAAVENDANAMAWGEYTFGAARGAESALFLTLGTGVGGGLVLGKRLFRGRDFSAAEIGHVRYRAGGTLCACGARGCIETELGNRYLVKKLLQDVRRGRAKGMERFLAKHGGAKLEAVTEAARRGNAYARAFWAEAGTLLGDFLGGICNLLNPGRIVIGGGVAQAGSFLFGPLRASLAKNAFERAGRARVSAARFGPDAGLIGAASLILVKP